MDCVPLTVTLICCAGRLIATTEDDPSTPASTGSDSSCVRAIGDKHNGRPRHKDGRQRQRRQDSDQEEPNSGDGGGRPAGSALRQLILEGQQDPHACGAAHDAAQPCPVSGGPQTSRCAFAVDRKTGMPNPLASRQILPLRVTSPRSAPRYAACCCRIRRSSGRNVILSNRGHTNRMRGDFAQLMRSRTETRSSCDSSVMICVFIGSSYRLRLARCDATRVMLAAPHRPLAKEIDGRIDGQARGNCSTFTAAPIPESAAQQYPGRPWQR